MDTLDWSPPGALAALDRVVADDPGDPPLSGPALVALATSWLHAPRSGLTGIARDTLHIHDDTIGRIERHAAVLRALDGRIPGDTLTVVVRAELRLVAALLTNASFTADVARRLFLTAADLAHLGGRAALSAGDAATAQRHYRAALHAAHAAGDRALGAYLTVCLAFTLGDPADASTLTAIAAQAATGAGEVPWSAVPTATLRCYPVADPTGPVRSGRWLATEPASTEPASAPSS